MFLAMLYRDQTAPATAQLTNAIDRYREKFAAEPDLALVNPAFKARLGEADTAIPVETAPYIPANTIYVGVKDEA